MTPDDSPLDSEAAFADALQSLVRRAHGGGVDVEGGWECRTDAELPDWDVVVTEVQTTAAADSAQSPSESGTVDD